MVDKCVLCFIMLTVYPSRIFTYYTHYVCKMCIHYLFALCMVRSVWLPWAELEEHVRDFEFQGGLPIEFWRIF